MTAHSSHPARSSHLTWSMLLLLLFLLTLNARLCHALGDKSDARTHLGASSNKWSLLWRDEFRQSGRSPDTQKWSHMLGDGSYYGIPGWGNGELQTYTEDSAYVSGGRLIIKAKARSNGDITSARLRSKFNVQPGYRDFKTIKISVRLKIPGASPGMWAAVWMLPETNNSTCSGCGRYGAWSSSGELDIWESVNMQTDVVTTVHYGGAWPLNKSWGTTSPVDGTQWNVMTILWEKDNISWYLNAKKVHEVWSRSGTRDGWFSETTQRSRPPFDRPFHVLLNLACGGSLTGNVDRRTVLNTLRSKPRSMHVDYIRIHGRR